MSMTENDTVMDQSGILDSLEIPSGFHACRLREERYSG